jgi:hypothetical protein
LVTPYLVEGMNPSEVPALPGERWRNPTEAELFLGADIGSELPPEPANNTPAPAYQGSYGFTAAPTTQTDSSRK